MNSTKNCIFIKWKIKIVKNKNKRTWKESDRDLVRDWETQLKVPAEYSGGCDAAEYSGECGAGQIQAKIINSSCDGRWNNRMDSNILYADEILYWLENDASIKMLWRRL